MAVWHPFGFSTTGRRAEAGGLGSSLIAVPSTLLAAPSAGAAAGGNGIGGSLACPPCDKLFPNHRAMQQHLKSHTKCEQCDFAATQSVVLEHIQKAHSTGSRWTYDAADIEKWRADRRKRYPTETNVKKREIADEDREVRGQVASTPMYRVGKGHYRDGKRQKRAPAAGDDVSEPGVDDTPSAQGAVEATASAPSLSSGGGLGLVSYSSSSEDEDNDAPSVASSSVPLSGPRIVVPPLSPSEVEAAAAARAAKGGREKNIATAEEKLAELEQSLEDPLKRLKAGKYKSSLLERLLASEIRRERNVVLQCIRHIVRHNFFE